MSVVRSSVHPKSSKQPWGTILKPEFGMGFQKVTAYEVDQTTNRLYYIPKKKECRIPRQNKDITVDQIDEMLERITKYDRSAVPDSDRRVQSSQYKDMGIVNSFAWKGYN